MACVGAGLRDALLVEWRALSALFPRCSAASYGRCQYRGVRRRAATLRACAYTGEQRRVHRVGTHASHDAVVR